MRRQRGGPGRRSPVRRRTSTLACPLRPAEMRSVLAPAPSSSSVTSSVRASSSIRFGGRSATPCDAIVRRRSTGSPPAPRSSISVVRAAIYSLQRSGDRVHSRRGDSRRRCRRHVHGRRPRRGWPHLDGEGADGGAPGGVGARGRSSRRRARPPALHARDDGRDERAPGAQGREDGVRRDSRVRASPAPAEAGASSSLPAVRRPSGAARPARSLLRRRRAHRAGRRPAAARSRVAAGDRCGGSRRVLSLFVPRREARSGRGRGVSEETARSARRRLPRDLAGVPRVRARLDDCDRRLSRPIVGAAIWRRSRIAAPRRGCPSRWSCARRAASRRSPRPRRIPPSRCSPAPQRARSARRSPHGRPACEDAVSLDMGGTSTDVALIRNGEVERGVERSVAGFPVRLPSVDIQTVGAGGGSIAWLDEGGALRVGPESAGADPGPACYGRGGTRPTVTDANLVLGRLPGHARERSPPRPRSGRACARRPRPGGCGACRQCRDGASRSARLGRAWARSARAVPRCVRRSGASPRLRACGRARTALGARSGERRRPVRARARGE